MIHYSHVSYIECEAVLDCILLVVINNYTVTITEESKLTISVCIMVSK